MPVNHSEKQPAAPSSAAACPKCSQPLRADANHCHQCGATVRGTVRHQLRLVGQLAALAITAVVFALGGWLVSGNDTELRQRVHALEDERTRIENDAQLAWLQAAEAKRRCADTEA